MEQETQRILLVDDDDDVRELLTELLEQTGYAVIAVADGRTAFEQLRTTSFDLLVTDLHLPDTQGTMVIRQAHLDQPAIITILMSGSAGVDALARQCGAEGWLQKGRPLDDFRSVIAAVTDSADSSAMDSIVP